MKKCVNKREERGKDMKKIVLAVLMILSFVGFNRGESEASYVSYFYTSGDAIVFTPHAATNVSVKTTSGTVVWAFTTISSREIHTKGLVIAEAKQEKIVNH